MITRNEELNLPVTLFRGPLLLAFVALYTFLPYIALLSWSTINLLSIAMVGFLILCDDISRFAEFQIRHGLRRILDGFVLDDFLKFIYDPEYGLIACSVGSFMGVASMYTLGMSEEQKAKLVEASLGTSNDEARDILLTPGGCKSLLPESVQEWISDEEKVEKMETLKQPSRIKDEDQSETSSTVEVSENGEDNNSISSNASQQNVSRGIPIDSNSREIPEHQDRIVVEAASPTNDGAKKEDMIAVDPLVVMSSIAKEMAIGRIKPWLNFISEPRLVDVGATTAMALLLQLALRMRSRTTLLSSISAVSLSAVVTGSVSSLLLRRAVHGDVHDKESLAKETKDIFVQFWKMIKSKVDAKGYSKGYIAILVLLYAGRRRRNNTGK